MASKLTLDNISGAGRRSKKQHDATTRGTERKGGVPSGTSVPLAAAVKGKMSYSG